MLPEMFWSANDCACRPETAVFRASKIPIPFLQLRSGRPVDSEDTWPQSREEIARSMPEGEVQLYHILKKKPRSADQGLNCRAGQHLPGVDRDVDQDAEERKSTRLNSSHEM